MNIFAVDKDPVAAAQALCNKHVPKMTLESAQMLCTNLRLSGVDPKAVPYKQTHVNHPSTKWARQTTANAAWLTEHMFALGDEFQRRFKKQHLTITKMLPLLTCGLLQRNDWQQHTSFAMAMPDDIKIPSDPVLSYRCYYISDKGMIARWAPRAKPPQWWPLKEENNEFETQQNINKARRLHRMVLQAQELTSTRV